MFHSSNICCAKQKDKFLLPGGVRLQLQRTDPQMYFSKKEFRRPGWGLLTVALPTANCPGIQNREWGGGSQWSKVREETGGGKRKCWTYKVMVRKPIWQGIWKSKAYRIKHHTQQSAAQSQLCFQQQDSDDRVKASACHPHRKPPLTLPTQEDFSFQLFFCLKQTPKRSLGKSRYRS